MARRNKTNQTIPMAKAYKLYLEDNMEITDEDVKKGEELIKEEFGDIFMPDKLKETIYDFPKNCKHNNLGWCHLCVIKTKAQSYKEGEKELIQKLEKYCEDNFIWHKVETNPDWKGVAVIPTDEIIKFLRDQLTNNKEE
jgi:hypothetical protein